MPWKHIRDRAYEAVLARPTDARVQDGSSGSSDPARDSLRVRVRRQRALSLIVGAMLVASLGIAIFGKNGYVDLRQRQQRFEQLGAEVDAQRQRVEDLKRAVRMLESDSIRTERLAREELGLVRQGEVTFLLADP